MAIFETSKSAKLDFTENLRGRKIAKFPQCGKMTNFLPLRFYVKSFLDVFRGSKTAILTILEALNVDFGKFLHFLKAKI